MSEEKHEIIKFGIYRLTTIEQPSDVNIWTDIEWIVLKRVEDKALLLSKDCLAWEFFSGHNTLFEPAKPGTWEGSYVRELLNGEIYNSAFTDEEKQVVLSLNEHGDKLFLLSKEEILDNLTDKELWQAEIVFADDTDDKIRIWKELSTWWINTVGDEPNRMCVMYDADICETGIYNDADEIGVRPAMWVDYRMLMKLRSMIKTWL